MLVLLGGCLWVFAIKVVVNPTVKRTMLDQLQVCRWAMVSEKNAEAERSTTRRLLG